MRVRVSNGKYTFVHDPLRVEILRYGEPWHMQQEAANALHSIMAELDAARVVLAAARDLGDDAPVEIKDALARHRALVDDRERPSAWSSPWAQDCLPGKDT